MVLRAMGERVEEMERTVPKTESETNDEVKRERTIFRPVSSEKKKAFRWNFIHRVLKYGLVVPILRVFFWLTRDICIKKHSDIPKVWYNNTIRIFDVSVDQSTRIWEREFLMTDRVMSRQEVMIKQLKNLVLTICLEDVVYRELLNIILLEFHNNMRKFHGNGQISHVFYQSPVDGKDIYFEYGEKNKIRTFQEKRPGS